MEIVFIEEELDGFVANLTQYKDGVYTVLGVSIAKIKEVKKGNESKTG